jgi:hypothetical protein
VKREEKEETALLNVERNVIFLLFLVIISALIIYGAFKLLQVYNPWGFIVAIPGAILSFQSLWLLLHPFALIYTDRFEIRQSFLHRKERYIVDIKKITQKKSGKIYITYNDDEVEKINLAGIKPSHVSLMKEQVEKLVTESLKTRS